MSTPISLHQHHTLGTRATSTAEDFRLYRLAQHNPNDPTLLAALSLPIAPSALFHIVSKGMTGWLCDLSITRISDIANAQLPPGGLDYFCFDATFFSQLCQRRASRFVFCYPAMRARFAEWLEDRYPFDRSLICIPSNTSGSHWNGSFHFLHERIILHVTKGALHPSHHCAQSVDTEREDYTPRKTV